MPNAVVVGQLRAIEPGRITLGGNLHIIVPPELVLPTIPLQSSVTVVVHEREDGQLIAESIRRSRDDGRLFG
jgi:hypothetical protein